MVSRIYGESIMQPEHHIDKIENRVYAFATVFSTRRQVIQAEKLGVTKFFV